MLLNVCCAECSPLCIETEGTMLLSVDRDRLTIQQNDAREYIFVSLDAVAMFLARSAKNPTQ